MKRPTKEEIEREILALDSLDTKALHARWRTLYRRDPPPKIRARLLRLGIAYRLQELVFGGLQPKTVRLLRKLATELRAQRTEKRLALNSDVTSGGRAATRRPTLAAGTQLMREWNGSTEIVDVTREGFRWRGNHYRTLSAVAVAITGTKWSGPKFFGLVGSRAGGSRRTQRVMLPPEPTEAEAVEGASA